MAIEIVYDGSFPNLCRGTLLAEVDGKLWEFPRHSLRSGGYVLFDDDWGEHISCGKWEVEEWPEGFPEEHKAAVEAVVNEEVPCGCCGGCV